MQQDEAKQKTPNIYGIIELDETECHDILRRQRLCVLATADGDQPYAVPIFYGFDGATIYLGIAEGRKTQVLESNPRLCITIAEVGPGDSWRSVVVMGRAEWIVDGPERTEAIRVMMEHNRRPERQQQSSTASPTPSSETSPGSPQRHRKGRMLRIADAQITGRAKG
ncbi:MAG: pyridoxamine 5'-phosphate oxidase family protein [Gemmatimonadaceae bacterium]